MPFSVEVVNRKNAEHYRWGEVCDGWHLLNRADLSVIQECVPAGAGETRHFHSRARQVFFVLSGAVELECDGTVSVLGPEDSLEVPPGVPHHLRNPGPDPALFLVISSPHSHGDRIAVQSSAA